MPRKRLTQIFPFLLPLRKWQRKRFFYLKMRLDGNRYARRAAPDLLKHVMFEASSPMLNPNSGFDMRYQENKVHNLRLAARTLDHILIRPGETFSFWQLVRHADRREKYKDGLELVGGRIVGAYGGGLCQMSNLLFWLFLHTPLTLIERHGHKVEAFPSTAEDLPCGTDATIHEGWLDLKVKNETSRTYQLEITLDGGNLTGRIRAGRAAEEDCRVYNGEVAYWREGGRTYQRATVDRNVRNRATGEERQERLYTNVCEIGYPLPPEIIVEERGD